MQIENLVSGVTQVKYIGGLIPKLKDKSGTFEGMIGSDTAKIRIDGNAEYCTLDNLALADSQESGVTPEVGTQENPEAVEPPAIVGKTDVPPVKLTILAEKLTPTMRVADGKAVFDKQMWIDAIDVAFKPYEDVEVTPENEAALLVVEKDAKELVKKLNARRLEVTEPTRLAMADLKTNVDAVGEHLISKLSKITQKRLDNEKKRKETKKADVDKLIADMKAKSDLPKEYLDKIVFDDKYYQVTFVGKKLNESIQAQFDTQIALKKGADDAALVEKMSIEKRELLVEKLNLQYGYNAKYSQVPHDKYTDEQVIKIYEDKKIRLEAETKKAEDELKAKEVAAPVPVEAPAKLEKPILQEPEPEPEDEYALPDFGLPEPEPAATPEYPYKIVKVIGISEIHIVGALNSLAKYNVSVEYINE